MDLSYITERIIALCFPASISGASYRRGQRQAAHMLRGKHGDNYMVRALSSFSYQQNKKQHYEYLLGF